MQTHLNCAFRAATIAILVAAATASPSEAQEAQPAANALPPLGWSSWNSFSNTIDSAITQQQADAMVSSGLKAAGYSYVNIDEGWWLGKRDAAGSIIVDPKQWPALAPGEQAGDMSNIVRYIHARGLKAGIYTDAGGDGCSIFPDVGPAFFNVGGRGHYEQDFLQFAKWGFDYVKVDWCGGDKENLSASVQYAEIVRAIDLAEKATGKRLYYSICNWGKQSPWTWGPGIGGATQAVWRTGGDIIPPVVIGSPNEWRRVTLDKIFKSFDDSIHPEGQHTGYYNDADMMVVGMPGTNAKTDRLHMTLWAMGGGPLLIGADLTKLDQTMLATLRNLDVLAIDQDPLGLQAVKVGEVSPGLEIWSKRLGTTGRRAVMLLNRTHYPAPFAVEGQAVGLRGPISSARDVWAGSTVALSSGALRVDVPAQDALLLMIQGEDAAPDHYTASTSRSQVTVEGVKARPGPTAMLRLTYRNSGPDSVRAIYVNGETGTHVAFPKTTGLKTVSLQIKMDRAAGGNRIAIEGGGQDTVRVVAVDVY